MHYLFFDESYSKGAGQDQLVMAGWAVEQGRLNRNLDQLSIVYKTPVMNQIVRLLDSTGAHAVLAKTNLEPEFWRKGVTDATNDIRSMARTDNVWSICSIFLITRLVTSLVAAGEPLGTVDIYFDKKKLKPDHGSAIANALRSQVVIEAKRLAPASCAPLVEKLRIRRLEPVTKAPRTEQRDKFQTSIWIADRLCANHQTVFAAGGSARIHLEDMTETVRRTVQQFEGKPYYAD